MARPGLTAPSSRQDVISAILNDYASFTPGPHSPYSHTNSPLNTADDVPPPPPSKDEKPLPSVTMQFQLRANDPESPQSYNQLRKDSIDSNTTKISFQSMKRSSKPPSLKLLASNGSTANLPPRPTLPAVSKSISPPVAVRPAPPAPRPREERPLPDLPPPPPEKSKRRSLNVMGNGASKGSKDPSEGKDEKDSKVQEGRSQAPAIVKRKPAPSLVKRFPSLAEIGKGPRGGLRPAARPPGQSKESMATIVEAAVVAHQASTQEKARKPSNPFLSEEEKTAPESQPRNAISGHPPTLSKSAVSSQTQPPPQPQPQVESRLPPTPESDRSSPHPPAPPKKTLPIGLPSNPRSRGQDASDVKHMRGKSSTGFNILQHPWGCRNGTIHEAEQKTEVLKQKTETPEPKAQEAELKIGVLEQKPVPTTTTTVDTITPGPTPSPKTTPVPHPVSQTQPTALSRQQIQAQLQAPESPVSPLTPSDTRPFAFETTQPQRQPAPFSPRAPSPISPPTTTQPQHQPQPQFPPRTTSRPTFSTQSLQSTRSQPTAPSTPPSLPTLFPRPSSLSNLPNPKVPAPPITPAHHACYARHARMLRSSNAAHPMACMVCRQHRREEFRSCYWCHLRVCIPCAVALEKCGRELGRVVAERGQMGEGGEKDAPGLLVWGAEGEYES
ncbi:hypothetical protein CC78DRAFT_538586 [Lojkania enalia]|uniref:Uncharacterized protein n=1 Tax=Lojkania enalia TaxID=147567 RepID=A0A9P4NCT4_9PLEO|nr:hypothetical protein CC78DRAFT_538586 [Didymosphaeria enalia]